jgi:hypothetical protein
MHGAELQTDSVSLQHSMPACSLAHANPPVRTPIWRCAFSALVC